MKIKLHIKLHSSSDPEISLGKLMNVPMIVVESRLVLCCLALLKALKAHILALFAQYFEYRSPTRLYQCR